MIECWIFVVCGDVGMVAGFDGVDGIEDGLSFQVEGLASLQEAEDGECRLYLRAALGVEEGVLDMSR